MIYFSDSLDWLLLVVILLGIKALTVYFLNSVLSIGNYFNTPVIIQVICPILFITDYLERKGGLNKVEDIFPKYFVRVHKKLLVSTYSLAFLVAIIEICIPLLAILVNVYLFFLVFIVAVFDGISEWKGNRFSRFVLKKVWGIDYNSINLVSNVRAQLDQLQQLLDSNDDLYDLVHYYVSLNKRYDTYLYAYANKEITHEQLLEIVKDQLILLQLLHEKVTVTSEVLKDKKETLEHFIEIDNSI